MKNFKTTMELDWKKRQKILGEQAMLRQNRMLNMRGSHFAVALQTLPVHYNFYYYFVLS